MSFDPAFRFYSDDPQERDCWVTAPFAEIEIEARDERDERRSFYPRMVAKGRMTEEAMKRELRVMAAIAWYFTTRHSAREHPRPDSSWAERVHVLRREIALRRTLYPRWVAAGRLTQDEAKRKLDLFETMHDCMWHEASADAAAGRDETERQTRLARAA